MKPLRQAVADHSAGKGASVTLGRGRAHRRLGFLDLRGATLGRTLEAVISQRICVQELELNLTSYLLFRGSKRIGFERFFDLGLITVDKL